MIGLEKPAILLLTLVLAPLAIIVFKADQRYSRIVTGLKALTILLLIISAASPFMTTEKSFGQQKTLQLIVDNSTSTQLMKNTEVSSEKVEIKRTVAATGNNSEIRSELIHAVKKNQEVLVVSDFQTPKNMKPVIEKARRLNTSINVLNTSFKPESSVKISGPKTTVPEASNTFTVTVESTAEAPKPKVTLDGETVQLEKTGKNEWQFTRTFDSKGQHRIKAVIQNKDRFKANNRFFKAVKVREKPEILVLGEKSDLGEKLSDFYSLSYKDSVPEDLEDYYAVIAKKKFDESKMFDYLIKGNGLIYTGEVEKTKTVLPVKKASESAMTESAKIMLVIDVSLSTGKSQSVKQEKRIAYSLVEKLPYNNKVGAIAYNTESYLVSKPKPLSKNREELKNKIARLETGGNSFHHIGLKAAKRQLNGTGNIILITDGIITDYGEHVNTDGKSRQIASNLETKLITVGVSKERNEYFLRDLASNGNGFYLDAEDSGRLNFIFKAGGTEDRAKKITVINNNHFITQGLSLSSTMTGFDTVQPKQGANLLITSTQGEPYLTTWRYGLGRVAAFTAGGKNLEELLSSDPELVSRTVSWAVGNPQRKQQKWIKIESNRKPEDVNVQASYEIKGLVKKGENLYTTYLTPEKTGFHSFRGQIYAYNYNRELEKIGFNRKGRELAAETGGNIYKPGKLESFFKQVKAEKSQKTRKIRLGSFFILAALITFLLEIAYRKRRGRR
ncbi:MAG: VWA domain-containing protein [Candidatus Nanohaloarchaea archaeon]